MRHRKGYSRLTPVLLIAATSLGFGCAQQVGDIDRTQPNKLEKRDFAGTWYYRQTIVDVPGTTPFMFSGMTTGLEKINWEITANSLIAYRAYELTPGVDNDIVANGPNGSTYAPGEAEGNNPVECAGTTEDCRNFKEAPVAAFSITNHFDVQRQYSSSTGEQTNVIVENASDRYWNQREYMRVNWSSNGLWNPVNLLDGSSVIQYLHYRGEEDPLANSVVQEYDEDGNMTYLEVTVQAILQPSIYCYYYYELDCGPVEVELVHSFSRVPEVNTYEPVFYDNHDMSKFGYFRNTRATYDRKRGFRRSGLVYLANRHNIFRTAYDLSGEAIPVSERDLKPVVYYLNEDMPEELWAYNKSIEENWDRAFRRAAAAATGQSVDEVPQMFYVCRNPVASDDPLACGDPGTIVRPGDVRYNHIYWVDDPSPVGPLGYGPSGTDPETGEIVSGTAYVYGASVDTYAAYALDIVELILACEEDEASEGCTDAIDAVTSGSKFRTDILSRLKPGLDPRASQPADGDRVPFEVPSTKAELFETILPEAKAARIDNFLANPRPYDPGFEERQMKRMRDNNLDLMAMDDEYVRGATNGQFETAGELDAETLEAIRPGQFLAPERMRAYEEARIRHFSENNIMDSAFMDDRVLGLARALADEVRDMPQGERQEFMFQKLRGLIYEAVMLHEIGHTVGLRHNFQGSYDSLNYFDEYWMLRQENMITDIGFVDEIFQNEATTDNQRRGIVNNNGEIKQLAGGINEYQYSSIMDYGLAFNSDIHGLGKYDEAAIIYAYTYGYDGRTDSNGRNIADRGYVEVFADEAYGDGPRDQLTGQFEAAALLNDFQQESLAYTHILELLHYSELIGGWFGGDASNLNKRELRKYDELLDMKEANDSRRPAEVPYMFCTDDWVGVSSSCHRWDSGADPYEQAMHIIKSYDQYYYFNNFARDRLNWSAFSVVNRTYSRYLQPLVNIYQQLYFAQESGVQGIYRWLGAHAGLNVIGRILTTPREGDHVEGPDGYLVHCREANSDPFVNSDGVETTTSDLCYGDNPEIAITIDKGVGRPTFTRYEYDEGHTYYYFPTEAGHFYDYLGAILAIASNRATVRGVDVQSDFLTYSIPYYLLFDQELTSLFNNIWTDKVEYSGNRVLVDSKGMQRLVPSVVASVALTSGPTTWDPITGAEVVDGFPTDMGSDVSNPVRAYHSFTMQYYALLYGMAFFTSNLDLRYPDQNKIFRLGAGEQVTPAGGFEMIQCQTPSGFVYAAVHDPTVAEETAAVRLIRQCSEEAERYETDPNARFDLENTIGYIDLMRSLYDIFGRL